MRISDWSSDVCSSDLRRALVEPAGLRAGAAQAGVAQWRGGDFVRGGGGGGAARASVQPWLGRRDRQMGGRAGGVGQSDDGDAAGWRAARAGDDDAPARSPRAGAGRSEEHTSELQSLMRISYAVFCLKNKKKTANHR